MASLSDQIDRLTRNTRSISTVASQIASVHPNASLFTRAVLTAQLGNLIRDVDPSELGLFQVVHNSSVAQYEKEAGPEIRRTEFPGATPLRKHPTNRGDNELPEPEVYARAALKYIAQYQSIRPMPSAYDRISAVLDKLQQVRANIKSLTSTLEKAPAAGEAPQVKERVEQEEQRIKELQDIVTDLSQKKEARERSQVHSPKQKEQTPNPTPPVPSLPPSPQEDKFWATPGKPSRILHFSDNLLDEEVNIGDISTMSFSSPTPSVVSDLKPLRLFGAVGPDSKNDASELSALPASQEVDLDPSDAIGSESLVKERVITTFEPIDTCSTLQSVVPKTRDQQVDPVHTRSSTVSRQSKIKIDSDVEKIVSKIWATMGDILTPLDNTSSVEETLQYLRELSVQTPVPESPIRSTVSSATTDLAGAPTFQQIQTAYLLTMLLSTSPNCSIPLGLVKESLTTKAKNSGVSTTGQALTRVLYNCIAKRLLKIDRGGREQIVKFDI